MIKQQIAAHAIKLKQSAMASVNACCLIIVACMETVPTQFRQVTRAAARAA